MSAVFCGRRNCWRRGAAIRQTRNACARSRTAPFCACSPSRRNWVSRFSRTASFAGRISWAISRTRSKDLTSATASRAVGARRSPAGPSLGKGRVAGVVVEKLRAVRPLTGHEVAVHAAAQPGRDQDDAAERHAVPGDFVQARPVREGLPNLLGAARGTSSRS